VKKQEYKNGKGNKMRKIGWASLLLAVIGMAGCINQQKSVQSKPGEVFEKTVTRQIRLNYMLYLPEGYEASDQKWPLVLFLHGAGERGDDVIKVNIHGPSKLAAAGKKFPFILIAPQCPRDGWWSGMTEDLMALVDDITQKYRVDTSRLYVTGLSMGGFGTWSLITQYPDKFAAAAPICGGGDDVLARFRLQTMPIWVFHGAKDNVVPLQKSEVMVNALKQVNNPHVKFTVYPEAGHDSWTETYNNPEFYDWLLSHSKP
jgi:predicted peptidase